MHPLSICRHPDEKKRPSFLNIVVALQQPDFLILNRKSQTVAAVQSNDLYQDLQGLYINVKKTNSETGSVGKDQVCSTDMYEGQSCNIVACTSFSEC